MACINNAIILSYLTAIYPFSLMVTISGSIFITSCAITPTSCPSWEWISFSGIQSNSTPLISSILSRAFFISLILSFNLSSEE